MLAKVNITLQVGKLVNISLLISSIFYFSMYIIYSLNIVYIYQLNGVSLKLKKCTVIAKKYKKRPTVGAVSHIEKSLLVGQTKKTKYKDIML